MMLQVNANNTNNIILLLDESEELANNNQQTSRCPIISKTKIMRSNEELVVWWNDVPLVRMSGWLLDKIDFVYFVQNSFYTKKQIFVHVRAILSMHIIYSYEYC